MEDIFTNLTKGYTDKEIKKDNIYQSGINELERTFPYKPEELSVKTIKLEPFYSNLFQSLISDEAEKRFEKAFYKTESKKKSNESNRYVTQEDVDSGEATEDEYVDSFEYIFSSLVNGNITQYKNQLKELKDNHELLNYQEWAKDMNVDPDIIRYLESKKRKSNESIEDLNKFIEGLQEVVYGIDNVKSIETFSDSGLTSNNDGFTIHTNDGHSFQVVITQES